MRRALLPLVLASAAVWTACGSDVSGLFGEASGTTGSASTGGVGGAGSATSSVDVSVATGTSVTTTGNPATTGVTTTTGEGGGPATTGNTTVGAGGEGGNGPASSSSAATTGSVATTTAGVGGAGGGVVDTVGCSDGTREYFTDIAVQPNIAGCDAGFYVQGVTTPASMAPACGRISGNDSANTSGMGCSVEDACSEGWYVCHGAADVAAHSSTGQCEPSLGVDAVFYITRQVQDVNGNCIAPPGTNNITGCGTLGGAPVNPATCLPLNRRMRQQDCGPTQNWYCGNDNSDGLIEANIVAKIGSGEGGVLCCKQ